MSCHSDGRDLDAALHKLCGRFLVLEEQVKTIKTNDLIHIQNGIDRVEKTVNHMANRGTRPPWSVVAIITFLSSMCIGLMVAFVKTGGL